jgi:prepilin-type N-terminal cleavage/methylation domain-containing protein
MRTERGFSMIELLIVVTIISLLAAIAIPNLRKARQSANAASAVQSLRTITTAQHLYKQRTKRYGTLVELAPDGTLDTSLGSGNKSSYIFDVSVSADFEHFTTSSNCPAQPRPPAHAAAGAG